MSKQWWAFSFALLFMLPGQANSQDTLQPMPLEVQEAMENAEKGIENADKALAAIEGLEHAVRKLKTQCMKAIGDPEFCECIGEWSPIGLTFMGYVSITAGTKEQFKYDQVSTENKELFDRTRAARDKCVSWKGKGSERAKN